MNILSYNKKTNAGNAYVCFFVQISSECRVDFFQSVTDIQVLRTLFFAEATLNTGIALITADRTSADKPICTL